MHLTTFSPKCCCCVSARVLPGIRAWRPYSNLENELLAVVLGRQGIENRRKLLRVELHVHYSSDNLMDLSIPDGIGGCKACEGKALPHGGPEDGGATGRAKRPLQTAMLR
jgi:hypothetical protein